ncbi:hypothetical protein OESDEN_14121 [Oesophagostomum dentatum]|uniref:Integrase catalytic domain-containing protein n=1 Tax=Oesophagostomum dentatum TaxID=61180 RepID=A0A0B1SRN3_OESDE|nr:hypothetical protein OESDEN_14121 [Oesophagostomum dentatum]
MLSARFGNPRVIVSDNGPQFTATEFQQSCTKQGIEHVPSLPFHPQSNCYRRTPGTSVPGSLSPAEIFLGRQIRTLLKLLKEPIKEKRTRNKKMEKQFNRHHGAQEESY